MTAPTSATSDPGRRSAAGRRDRRAGFTLLESVLALALIGLISALALPWALPDRSTAALRMKAFEIAALLRADRNAALRSGRPVATAIELEARRIASGASGAVIVLPESFDLRLESGRPNGFEFLPDGRASGGELTLARRQAALAIRVNRLTAAVEIGAP